MISHFRAPASSIISQQARTALRVMLRGTHTMLQPQYYFSHLDAVENVEMYQPGGFHPVSIGDIFADGRYRVLHKLGFGESSTVWLARDQRQQEPSSFLGNLVTLKILSAYESSKSKGEIAELAVPLKLDHILRAGDYADHQNVRLIKDYFMKEGPNGTHLCLVYQFSGPNVLSMLCYQGKVAGNKRLRGDLARKVAKQTATVVKLMHSTGLVHGDLTARNILFQVSDQVFKWTDDKIYSRLGELETEPIVTLDNSLPGPSAPRELVSSIDNARVFFPYLLQENITVIDFGESFDTNCPPADYKPATALNYLAPEALFESRFSTASDIWALACTIFEIRAGFPLFEFFGDTITLVNDIVDMLGKLPEPWWSAFESHECFEQDGVSMPIVIQKQEGEGEKSESSPPVMKSSIRQRLREIGEQDEPLEGYQGYRSIIEPTGTRLEEEEVLLLGGLLERMLKYRPEERITIQEIVQHPWFEYTSSH